MTFSEKIKSELSVLETKKGCCQKAQSYGMLLFGYSFTSSAIALHTVNKAVADCYADLLVSLTGCIVTVTEVERDAAHDKTLYLVEVEDENDRLAVLSFFSHQIKEQVLRIQRANFPGACCVRAFLRGCFMVCGSMIDPSKEYHLEFVVPYRQLAVDLQQLLSELGINARLTERSGSQVLYIKESEQIEDFLTLTGAVKSSLQLMEIKIVKDVRNKVNRMTNCETANIEKTVAASSSQVRDIEWIFEKKGKHYLPDSLQLVAELRLANPELSLTELCEVSGLGLSKSGMNHRLKKISEIAADGLNTSLK